MIKNSIDLAQTLAAICTEQYTSTFYKIVQQVYTCLNGGNTLFIYTCPEKHGIALDFATKLSKGNRRHQIVVFQVCFEMETSIFPEDTLLILDNNPEILDVAKKSNVFTVSLASEDIKANISYIIPTTTLNRTSEVQNLLLNSISENCLKFLS